CALGRCIAACDDDDDCDGDERCDEFGRCTSVAGLVVAAPVSLRLDPSFITVVDHDDVASLRVRADVATAARVVGEGGVLVACDGVTFASSCTLQLAAGINVIAARAGDDVVDDDFGAVRVFAGTVSRATTVVLSAQSRRPFGPAPALDGRYVGSAVLVEAGAVGSSSAPRLKTSLPIDAEIFAGTVGADPVIVIDDLVGHLAPGGRLIGHVANGVVDFPDFRAFNASPLGLADSVDALVTPSADAIVFAGSTTTPQLTWTQTFVRDHGTRTQTLQSWQITLVLAGPRTTTTAPTVPADVTTAVRADAAVPLPWERVSRVTYPDLAGIADSAFDNLASGPRNQAASGLLGGTPTRGDVCLLDDADLWGTSGVKIGTLMTIRSFGASIINGTSVAARRSSFADGAALGRTGLDAPFAAADAATNGIPETIHVSWLPVDDPRFATAHWRRNGVVVPRAIPCTIDSDPVNNIAFQIGDCGGAAPSFPPNGNVPTFTVDSCAELAAQTGCTVVDVDDTAERINGALNIFIVSADGSCAVESRPTIPWHATRVCQLPEQALACGEQLSCVDEASTTLTDLARGGDTIVTRSGDLGCAVGDEHLGFDADADPDAVARDVIAGCLRDLDRAATVPVVGTGTGLGALLAAFDGSRACFDAGRVFASIAASGAALRQADAPLSSSTNIDRASALHHRLLQRLLEVQLLLGRNVVEVDRIAAVVRDENLAGAPERVDVSLNRLLDGLALMVHPRFARGLENLPTSVLVNPDYRGRVVVDEEAAAALELRRSHSQPLLLAVQLIEGLSTAYELDAILLERDSFSGQGAALPHLSRTSAIASVIEPFAASLVQRALTQTAQPAWLERYDAALLALDVARGQAETTARRIVAGANPFGIEDEDLPLYFLDQDQGPGGRFAAISDFILGTSLDDTSWAPTLVRRAQTTMTAARAAWLAREQRTLDRARDAAAAADDELAVRTEQGERIAELCGLPAGLDVEDVFGGWQDAATIDVEFDPNVCFVRTDNADCTASFGDLVADAFDVDNAGNILCLAENLHRGQGDVARVFACNGVVESPVACTIDNDDGTTYRADTCARCTNGTLVPLEPWVAQLAPRLATGGAVEREAERSCRVRFPNADRELPSVSEATSGALDNPTCYRGSLGELALTVRAAALDVDIARSELDDLSRAYDIAMASCMILKLGNDQLEDARRSHDDTMHKLRVGKAVADSVAAAASAVKDCATAAGSDTKFGVAAGVACGAAGVEGAANVASIAIEAAMDDAQAAHDTFMANLEGQIDEDRCFKDAEMNLVGAQTATLRIQRANADLQRTVLELDNGKATAERVYRTATSRLNSIDGADLSAPAFDFWLDDEAAAYVRDFRLAKRAVYLAVRAVEYEYQQSQVARGAALSAEIPDDLVQVLLGLQAAAQTRSIGGNRPSNLKVVLSLKQHLLQLADRRDRPATEQALSDTERLRLLLTDERYAAFNDDGSYAGQRIPFRLAPLETLGLGNTAGIGLFAANDCAERLWSVNASIQGTDPFVGDDSAFVRLDVLKSNTFFSQWCQPAGQPSTFQTASVRPSRNLFRDNEVGGATGVGNGVGVTSAFSRARMQAVFNVDRAAFSDDAYENGESSELAARGLWGDYALLFPAATL
ncbi:MAG TPA: hypothetical protein VGF99_18185, partial [Myxococcota bacterium]